MLTLPPSPFLLPAHYCSTHIGMETPARPQDLQTHTDNFPINSPESIQLCARERSLL